MSFGKKEETVVQVQQTAVQSQETNVGSNKALQDTVDGLVSVLAEQAKNPAPSYVVPVIVNGAETQGTTGATSSNTEYQNNQLRSLLSSMYLNMIQGPQTQKTPSSNSIDTKTLILLAVIAVTVMFYFSKFTRR